MWPIYMAIKHMSLALIFIEYERPTSPPILRKCALLSTKLNYYLSSPWVARPLLIYLFILIVLITQSKEKKIDSIPWAFLWNNNNKEKKKESKKIVAFYYSSLYNNCVRKGRKITTINGGNNNNNNGKKTSQDGEHKVLKKRMKKKNCWVTSARVSPFVEE